MVAIIPLMRGDFQVKHVTVDAALINLVVDENGNYLRPEIGERLTSRMRIGQRGKARLPETSSMTLI